MTKLDCPIARNLITLTAQSDLLTAYQLKLRCLWFKKKKPSQFYFLSVKYTQTILNGCNVSFKFIKKWYEDLSEYRISEQTRRCVPVNRQQSVFYGRRRTSALEIRNDPYRISMINKYTIIHAYTISEDSTVRWSRMKYYK